MDSARSPCQQLGISKSEAQRFINEYFAQYAGVREYLDSILAAARVDNALPRSLDVAAPSRTGEQEPANRGFAERTATNTPLQGSAADLIKVAISVSIVNCRRAASKRGYSCRFTTNWSSKPGR